MAKITFPKFAYLATGYAGFTGQHGIPDHNNVEIICHLYSKCIDMEVRILFTKRKYFFKASIIHRAIILRNLHTEIKQAGFPV